ncbi:Hypothetical protein LUCI_3740 [Lucifera butyrica]|uniref:Uncharacterized protein n=1 Tax=Lucifera butyrica TaxID=1351585 RepID=A0A498RH56_9FIRM|nr:hypothetical protein [Lucifera butyrica]VBB08468.1 Hypothetical protein LUCI_3740 [Lucifera butyrica]
MKMNLLIFIWVAANVYFYLRIWEMYSHKWSKKKCLKAMAGNTIIVTLAFAPYFAGFGGGKLPLPYPFDSLFFFMFIFLILPLLVISYFRKNLLIQYRKVFLGYVIVWFVLLTIAPMILMGG